MKKKVIVHIGPPKTGTSVLQNWFNANHKLLAENGIFYPKHSVDQNGVSSGNKDLFLEKCAKTGVISFNEAKYLSLLETFQKGPFQRLLISSEFFFAALPKILTSSKEFEVEVVAYIRPEYEFLESIYNQSVKRNKQTKRISLRSSLPSSYLDRVLKYIETFGSDTFHLRAYGVGDFFENGIVADFMDFLAVDATTSKSEPYINSSYRFECLEFKRWTNRFELNGLDRILDSHLQAYDKGIRNYTVIPYETYVRYQEESKQKIRALDALASIANVESLFKYIDTRERGEYFHQDLYDAHVRYVASFMLERDALFVKTLIKAIRKQLNDSFDAEKLSIVEQCYEQHCGESPYKEAVSKIIRQKVKALMFRLGL